MKKISQKQLLKDLNGKIVNLLGVPFHTWSALVVDEEEKLQEWLYKAEHIDVSHACKGDYQPCYTTSNRIHRGGAFLMLKVIQFIKHKTISIYLCKCIKINVLTSFL